MLLFDGSLLLRTGSVGEIGGHGGADSDARAAVNDGAADIVAQVGLGPEGASEPERGVGYDDAAADADQVAAQLVVVVITHWPSMA